MDVKLIFVKCRSRIVIQDFAVFFELIVVLVAEYVSMGNYLFNQWAAAEVTRMRLCDKIGLLYVLNFTRFCWNIADKLGSRLPA